MPTKRNFINIFSGTDENGRTEEYKITIPIIQRDYAQGRTDDHATRVRKRFLSALRDALTERPITLDFIYGNIDEDNNITLLDGQQRITTLFLLYLYAAKKAGCPPEEYSFLKRFSYETRYSSRSFCAKLVDYVPDFEAQPLSEDIENRPWFTLGWKNDPTIKSMLVMIDAIDDCFKDIPDLWEKLKSNAIAFYFLPIENMGLTDELYIKMNSRGKPLSEFENFKAELEGEIAKKDPKRASEISRKIDSVWTDLLWNYKDNSNTIDAPFLKIFRIVCQIIAYRNNESFVKNGAKFDSFDLLNKYYSADSDNFLERIDYLENYLDTWYEISQEQPLHDFFDRFLSTEHVEGKVKISGRNASNIDIFGDSITNDYTLPKFILLYAFFVYVNNRDKISEERFCRRLRAINNLIQNSEDEISDNEDRAGGNRMPAIFRQVETIILEERTDPLISASFNKNQLAEEMDKIAFTNNNPDRAEVLYALEDHDLLQGQIAVIGLENQDMFERFEKLFSCNYEVINRALLSQSDYSQTRKYGGIYQLGSSSDKSWRTLFHRSANNNFDETHDGLVNLLRMFEDFSDEELNELADRYLAECEQGHKYDWRYYMVKYDSFRSEKGYGLYYGKSYEMYVMVTEKRLSEKAYDPFLKTVSKNLPGSWLDYYNGETRLLRLPDSKRSFVFAEDAIHVMEHEDDNYYDDQYGYRYKEVDRVQIDQDDSGIDTEDRVQKLLGILSQA